MTPDAMCGEFSILTCCLQRRNDLCPAAERLGHGTQGGDEVRWAVPPTGVPRTHLTWQGVKHPHLQQENFVQQEMIMYTAPTPACHLTATRWLTASLWSTHMNGEEASAAFTTKCLT